MTSGRQTGGPSSLWSISKADLKHIIQHQPLTTERALHLAQKADSEVDAVRKARHGELIQLARQVELLSRISVPSQFSNPLAYYQARQNWDEEWVVVHDD